jgi:SNF2 family DNA or RNA helicase
VALNRVVQKGGLLLSTYETVSNELNLAQLRKTKWDCLVIDEATKIKNSRTGFFKALRALASSSRHRLALTATPFENNLGELWSLFDFACRGKLLGDKLDFERHFAGKIGASDAVLSSKMSKALRKVIGPFMLRREKTLLKQEAPTGERMPEFNVDKVVCFWFCNV